MQLQKVSIACCLLQDLQTTEAEIQDSRQLQIRIHNELAAWEKQEADCVTMLQQMYALSGEFARVTIPYVLQVTLSR